MLENTTEGTEEKGRNQPEEGNWEQLSLPFMEEHLQTPPVAQERKQNGNPDRS